MAAGGETAGVVIIDRATPEPTAEAPAIAEPGSFRDRNGTVFYRDGRVFRALSARALANWRQLEQTAFFSQSVAAGDIVETWPAETAAAPIASPIAAAGVIEHARIPFVSYPYEWSFGMLRDAALLHLRLMRSALAADMILKDSSPYNIQWIGARPVFIDIPSIEPLRAGEPWVGYRQFCEMFLYPLMLTAYRGVDFRPWLRGRIDGITAEEVRRLMSARDLARSGVLLHVVAHGALQRRYAGGGRNVRGALTEAGFGKSLIETNVDKLTAIVKKLAPKRTGSQWSEYERAHSYAAADVDEKAAFVERAAASRRWRLAWDLGCNTGAYARIVAPHADCVVAMDADAMAVEVFYRRLRDGAGPPAPAPILPLVVDLADASPNQGWLGAERKGLAERGRPQLTLCLALVHHVVITHNIPLASFLDWLAGLGTAVVIELVGRDDEMVQALLAGRDDQYDDYYPETFRALLADRFAISAEQPIKDGKRQLYFAEPRRCAG